MSTYKITNLSNNHLQLKLQWAMNFVMNVLVKGYEKNIPMICLTCFERWALQRKRCFIWSTLAHKTCSWRCCKPFWANSNLLINGTPEMVLGKLFYFGKPLPLLLLLLKHILSNIRYELHREKGFPSIAFINTKIWYFHFGDRPFIIE